MFKLVPTLAIAAVALTLSPGPQSQALAQSGIEQVQVAFPRGRSNTVITRTIRGRQTIDFVVNARAGQRLVATMTSNNRAAYFNILAPGEQYVAFYTGDSSTPANTYRGTVPKSGNMKFRVYLFRNAARQGQTANIRLSIGISGAAGAATTLPGDALVPGTNYHATGPVGCSFRGGPATRTCEAGVRRKVGPDGTTFVEVKKPDGRTRVIFFKGLNAFGADSAQADGSASWSFRATRQNYETTISYGPESYVIPDAMVVGG